MGMVDYQNPAKVRLGKTDERSPVQTVTETDRSKADLMQHSATVWSSDPSQVKGTALACAQVVLAVLERGQQVLQQDPDPRCLEWIGGCLHTEIGNAAGR